MLFYAIALLCNNDHGIKNVLISPENTPPVLLTLMRMRNIVRLDIRRMTDLLFMAINENHKLPIVIRILGGLGGLAGGGIIGTILITLIIVVTEKSFGLNNIWPDSLVGAFIGLFLGFSFPKVGKTLADILNYL